MDENILRWQCGTCGRYSPAADKTCVACGVSRSSGGALGVLDTRSFIIPTRRRAMWIWIAISTLLPLLMSGVYLLASWLFK